MSLPMEWVTSKHPSQCGEAKEGTAGGSGVEGQSGFESGVRGEFVGLLPLMVVIREEGTLRCRFC